MSIRVGLKLAWGVVGASLDGSLIYPNASCGRGLLVWRLWYALVSADGSAAARRRDCAPGLGGCQRGRLRDDLSLSQRQRRSCGQRGRQVGDA